MSKTAIKFLLWVFIITFSGSVFLGAIYGVGSLITYFNTGADPAAALNIHPNVPLDWPVNVQWLPDDADTGREMEPFIREAVEAAYIRAWLQQGFSYTKGEPHGLKTYFTGPALAMVEENIEHVSGQDLGLTQVATDHLLQLHFYSADGTIAVFTDRQARVAQHLVDGNGMEMMAEEDLAAYQVVMLVDEGNWKVRHWLRRDLEEYGVDRPIDESFVPPSEELVRVEGGRLMLGDEPYEMRGFNYYPQENTWTDMWSEYEGNTISDDMALISSMGMNTVRIFVPYELFGVDEVLDNAPDYAQRLRDILNEAWRHDLRVIVTLYDFKSDYNLLTWPKADRHLEELLTTFNRHPAILAWDIKNEPDLDYEAAGEELVNIWLKHAVDQAHIYDPYHLVTIGWAHAENADELADMVDFVSFHYYAPADQFIDTVTDLKIKVGAETPVILGEFGLPTWNSYLFPNGHTEEEQYNYLRELLLMMEDGATDGYLAWTLYDFTDVPSQVAGRLPWKRSPQKMMGIIRPDGSEKPVAKLFQQPVSNALLTTELEEPRGLKPFWQTVAVLLFVMMVTIGAALWYLWRYLVDRFGEEIPDEEAAVPTDESGQPEQKTKYKMRQKIWRAWRAGRLRRWRKRRNRRYARWDRRKARRARRWARRRAWWLKITNIGRILIGRPIKVNDAIEKGLQLGHDMADPQLNSELTSQGQITMSDNEFKPLIEIPEGVKAVRDKIKDGDSALLSGNSDAQAQPEEKKLKSKAELIRELLSPVESSVEVEEAEKPAKQDAGPISQETETAAQPDQPVSLTEVAADSADSNEAGKENDSAVDDSQSAKTQVAMRIPSIEEIKSALAAEDAPSAAIDTNQSGNADQDGVTLETAKPDTTEIYDIGQPDDPAEPSSVQLVFDEAAEKEAEEKQARSVTLETVDPDSIDIYYLGQAAETETAEQPGSTEMQPPQAESAPELVEEKVQEKAPEAVPAEASAEAEALLESADYSAGHAVIHIDLSERPADMVAAENIPEDTQDAQNDGLNEEESSPKADGGKPGDGFVINKNPIAAAENEFAFEDEQVWPSVKPTHSGSESTEKGQESQPTQNKVEAPEPVAETVEPSGSETAEAMQKQKDVEVHPFEENKVIVEADNQLDPQAQSEIPSAFSLGILDGESEAVPTTAETETPQEAVVTDEAEQDVPEKVTTIAEEAPAPIQSPIVEEPENSAEEGSIETEPVEEARSSGLTKEEIDRFFSWED